MKSQPRFHRMAALFAIDTMRSKDGTPALRARPELTSLTSSFIYRAQYPEDGLSNLTLSDWSSSSLYK